MAKKAKKIALKSPIGLTIITAGGGCLFTSPEGVEVSSSNLEAFNATLEQLGYEGVKVTFNVLNKGAGSFLITASTPWCCNPRSEAYHQM